MEALYNAGDMDADLLVVERQRDVDIPKCRSDVELSRPHPLEAYTSVRRQQNRAGNRPPVQAFARRWEEHLKEW